MSFLYMVTVYPLELIYKYIYLACVFVAGSYGIGLMVMSLVAFAAFVPLKAWAKKASGRERRVQDVMAPQIAKIQSESTGAERQKRISGLFRRYGYHPVMAVRSAVGAGLQIPFLMAAYYMIVNLKGLEGQSFLFVKDLSKPDALLFGLNFLPILMTLINFATTFTTKDMRKKDRIQAVVIALLFLALLYNAPSALLIYWTCNNILYLSENVPFVKAVTEKAFDLARRAFVKGMKTDIVSTVFFGLLCGLFFFMFVPMNSYWRNVNEFDFEPEWLVRTFLPYAFVCASAVAGASFAALKIKKPFENGVSGFHIVVLSVMIAMLVEGTLMSYGLNQLNGRENLFASKGRLIADSLVWIGIIGGFMYFRRSAARHFVMTAALFVFVCCATLIDTNVHRAEKVIDLGGGADLANAATGDDVGANLLFSENDNILIIMPDALDTASLEKTLELDPSLKKQFKGFYLFEENLGAGGNTLLAIPQILKGKTFDGRHYREFVQSALSGEDSLPTNSVRHGRKTFVSTPFWNIVRDASAVETEEKKKKEKGKKIGLSVRDKTALAFRFMPHAVKGMLENVVNYRASPDFGVDQNAAAAAMLTGRMKFKTDRPVTHFIHMDGAHPPFDDRIEKVKEWLSAFEAYIKGLKIYGFYDKATIIVIADHGDYDDHRDYYPERKGTFRTFHFPAFLIKTPDSQGELTVRNDLTSTVYLKDLLDAFYEKGQTLATLNEFLAGLPSKRRIFINREKGFEPDTKYVAEGNFSTLTLKKDAEGKSDELKPTEENVLYTFDTQNMNYPMPDWKGKNFGKYGQGCAEIGSKSEMSLRSAVKGKTKKHLYFGMVFGQKMKVRITDLNTKKSVVASSDDGSVGMLDQKFLYASVEAESDKNGVFNLSFENLDPSSYASLLYVQYGNEKTPSLKTGRTYRTSAFYPETYGAFLSGWSYAENEGNWTNAEKAEARFRLASRSENDLKVTMTVSFWDKADKAGLLRIRVSDGRVVFEKNFPAGASKETVAFVYPSDLIREDRFVRLTIESDVRPYFDTGKGLGVFLSEIRFDKSSE